MAVTEELAAHLAALDAWTSEVGRFCDADLERVLRERGCSPELTELVVAEWMESEGYGGPDPQDLAQRLGLPLAARDMTPDDAERLADYAEELTDAHGEGVATLKNITARLRSAWQEHGEHLTLGELGEHHPHLRWLIVAHHELTNALTTLEQELESINTYWTPATREEA